MAHSKSRHEKRGAAWGSPEVGKWARGRVGLGFMIIPLVVLLQCPFVVFSCITCLDT